MANNIGDKFGKIEIVEFRGQLGRQGNYKFCVGKCECGVIREFRVLYLRVGRTFSCGCSQRKQGADHPSYKGVEEIDGSFWYSIHNTAKRKSRVFDLTIDQIWDKFLEQDRKCALSGLELKMLQNSKTESRSRTASLDRIDSKRGYTIDNVQWVHKDINQMKWDFATQDFIKLCDSVAEHNSDFVCLPPESTA